MLPGLPFESNSENLKPWPRIFGNFLLEIRMNHDTILGLYRDNGKDNGKYYIVIGYIYGVYGDLIIAGNYTIQLPFSVPCALLIGIAINCKISILIISCRIPVSIQSSFPSSFSMIPKAPVAHMKVAMALVTLNLEP